MPAKSLKEAIKQAIQIGPLNQMELKIKGELNDYLAHSVIRYLGPRPALTREALIWDFEYELLARFIREVTKE